jgi:hypothetical protein
MQNFRVDEYIEARLTGRHWDVSATDVFEAVDSIWWIQYTSNAPRGDLVAMAVRSDDDPTAIPSAGLHLTENPVRSLNRGRESE